MPLRKLLNALSQELSSAGLRGSGAGGFAAPVGHSPQVPQGTPCPRQQPQAGHQDWIGLNDARFATFNVCPSCYHSFIGPTPYAGAFITKGGAIAPPPNVPVRCDMARFWVRTAGTVLLTMNQDGLHDITLLARVAGIRAQDGDCPNAQLAEGQPPATSQRTWYTIQDPQTGAQPLQGWTVCAACLISIQTCCPAIVAGFAPLYPAGPRQSTCALVPSDMYGDLRTAEILEQVGGCALKSRLLGRPDVSQLVGWLRENPPRPQGGNPLTGSASAPVGLCPRKSPSTTLSCHTMRGLFDFTVCQQCYADVIQPDLARGVELARQFDTSPAAMPSGFTCQLYSERMRRVWSEAASAGDFNHLQKKVRFARLTRWHQLTCSGRRTAGQGERAADQDGETGAASVSPPDPGANAGTPGYQRHVPRRKPREQQYSGISDRRRAPRGCVPCRSAERSSEFVLVGRLCSTDDLAARLSPDDAAEQRGDDAQVAGRTG